MHIVWRANICPQCGHHPHLPPHIVNNICVREWYSPYVKTKSLLKWSFGKKTLKCQKFQMKIRFSEVWICATSISPNLKPKMRVIVIFSWDWKCNQKQAELQNRQVGIEIECDHLYYLFNRAFFVPSFILGFTNNQNPFQPVQSKKQCIFYKKMSIPGIFLLFCSDIFWKNVQFVSQSKLFSRIRLFHIYQHILANQQSLYGIALMLKWNGWAKPNRYSPIYQYTPHH